MEKKNTNCVQNRISWKKKHQMGKKNSDRVTEIFTQQSNLNGSTCLTSFFLRNQAQISEKKNTT